MASSASQPGLKNSVAGHGMDHQHIESPHAEQAGASPPISVDVAGDDAEDGHATSAAEPHTPEAEDRDRRFLFGLVIVCFVVMGTQWVLLTREPEPLPWQTSGDFDRLFRVDVNNATWIEWSQLDGIGQGLAHRIVADRRFNGPFTTIEDVARVPGIGEVTLEEIGPWLIIHRDADGHIIEDSAIFAADE